MGFNSGFKGLTSSCKFGPMPVLLFVTNAHADHDLPEILYRGEGKTAHASTC